jgi:hypothetical protein
MWTAVKIALNEEDASPEELTKDVYYNQPKDKLNYHYFAKADANNELTYWREPYLSDRVKVYQLGNYATSDNKNFGEPISDDITNEITAEVNKAIPDEFKSNKNQFFMPPAGVTNVVSKTISGNQTLAGTKTTTIEFTVHNFHDYDKIYSKFFLRPGARIFLDYGWGIDGVEIYNPTDIINHSEWEDYLFNDEFPGIVPKSVGDIDVIYGRVGNYTTTVGANGEFNCTVNIISENIQLFNISFEDNKKLKNRILHTLDSSILNYAVEVLFGDTFLNIDESEFNESGWEKLRTSLASSELSGGADEFTQDSYDIGVYWKGVKDKDGNVSPAIGGDIFISYGLFEDMVLNGEFSSTDGKVDFDSRNCWIPMPRTLLDKQNIFRKEKYKLDFLYPTNNFDITYNNEKFMDKRPNRFDGGLPPYLDGSATYTEYCKSFEKIPVRELFISLELIKHAFTDAKNSNDALSKIFDSIFVNSNGLIKLQVDSTRNDNSNLSVVQKDSLPVDDVKSPTQINQFMKNMFVFRINSPNSIVRRADMTYRPGDDKLNSKIGIQSMADLGDSWPLEATLDDDIVHSLLEGKNVITLPTISQPKHMNQTIESHVSDTYNSEKIIKKFKNTKQGTSNSSVNDTITSKIKDLKADKSNTENSAKQEDLEDPIEFNTELEKERSYKIVNDIDSYFNLSGIKEKSKIKSPIIPITLTLVIDGFAALVPGDMFIVDYLPERYLGEIYFTVLEITQTITPGDWVTNVRAQMLLTPITATNVRAGDNPYDMLKLMISKFFLASTLNLNGIGNVLKGINTITPVPVDSKLAKDAPSLDYIFNIHLNPDTDLKGKKIEGVMKKQLSSDSKDEKVILFQELITAFKSGNVKKSFTISTEKVFISGKTDVKKENIIYEVPSDFGTAEGGYKILTFKRFWYILEAAIVGDNLIKICQALEILFGTTNRIFGKSGGKSVDEWSDIIFAVQGKTFKPPEPVTGCMNEDADNYKPDATIDDPDSCLFIGCMDDGSDPDYPGRPVGTVPGRAAHHYSALYNTEAGCEDYSSCCIYAGCTDSKASNYCEDCVIQNNDVCVYEGCTDATSYTYWVEPDNDLCRQAGTGCVDDGSCMYMGCTDSTAFNYDKNATEDDGCCGPPQDSAFTGEQMYPIPDSPGIRCNTAAGDILGNSFYCVCSSAYSGDTDMCNYTINVQIELDKWNEIPNNDSHYTQNGGNFDLDGWIAEFEELQSKIDVYIEWELRMYDDDWCKEWIPPGYGII